MTHLLTRGEQQARKHHQPWTETSLSTLDMLDRGLIRPPERNPMNRDPWTPLWAGLFLCCALVVIVGALVLVGA